MTKKDGISLATDAKLDALYGEDSVRPFFGYSGSTFPANSYGVVITYGVKNGYCYQVLVNDIDKVVYKRFTADGNTWENWKSITTDMPSFYKNYQDLSALAAALKAIW